MNILLCVTGSVAAIKTEELLIILKKSNFNVKCVLTRSSLNFINLDQLKHLDVEVYQDDNEYTTWKKRGDTVLHIELKDWADIILIAPLSANTLAKIVAGMCDNLLTCVLRAWNPGYGYCKELKKTRWTFFAPAMNTDMWNHPITSQQISYLKGKLKWIEIPPIKKILMCGAYGKGAMESPENILLQIKSHTNKSRKLIQQAYIKKIFLLTIFILSIAFILKG